MEKILKYVLIGLRIIVVFFLVISISVLIIQIADNSKLGFLWNSIGLNNFISLFDTSIKFLAALIGIIAVWVTLERFSQTDRRINQAERQMNIISDNNKFNNFLAHKKYFIDSFKLDTLLVNHIKETSSSNEKILNRIYHSIYYKSYHDFQPNINDKFKLEIENSFKKINDLDIKFTKDIINDDILGDLKVFIFQSTTEIDSLAKSWRYPDITFIKEYGKNKYQFNEQNVEKYYKIIVNCGIVNNMLRFYLQILSHDGVSYDFDFTYTERVRAYYVELVNYFNIEFPYY